MTQTADPFFDRALLAVLPVFAKAVISPVGRAESDIAKATAAAVQMAEQAVLQRRGRNTALMGKQRKNTLSRGLALDKVLERAKTQWPHMRDEHEVQRMREQLSPQTEAQLSHLLDLATCDFRAAVAKACGEAIT